MITFLGQIFGVTWFIWSFVFVFSLAWGIRDWVHDESCSPWPLVISGIALDIIIAGIISFAIG